MAIVFAFLFILGRLFYVQVINAEFYQEKAIKQWTREIPIVAKRGDIIDSNGVVLATSKTSYAVFARPRSVTDANKVANVMQTLFGVDYDSLLEKLTLKKTSEITIKRGVSREQVKLLEAYNLDGVYYSVDNQRYYPFSETLCQILGYTSIDGVGVSGLEKYYDKYLKGINGEILYEADLVGVDIEGKTPSYVSAVDGLNVKLNIDYKIQQICEYALQQTMLDYNPKSASVIVLEPSSCKVIAAATYPNYDLNDIPRDNLDELNKLSRSPLIVDAYEPGSTFKIVTSIANIEEGLLGNQKALPLSYVFNSNRYRVVLGRKIKCWSTHANGKHQNQTLKEALNNSCNPCFVDMALSLGKETTYKYINSLGFGSVTGIDFLGEASGMVLPVQAVTEGDLARISFGQTIAVTPLQLAAAVSAIVNGGEYFEPQIVNSITDTDGNLVEQFNSKYRGRVCSKEASKILNSYLESVVSEGSGKNAFIEGYKVAGKTGTAQKYDNGVISQGKYVMSFIGYFPSNKPEYLALAIVDEPIGGTYGSTVCAPIVKQIFEGIISYKNIEPYEKQN